MQSRKDVIDFINAQLGHHPNNIKRKHNKYHYGYVELRDLLDFLYDGLPTTKEEEL